MIIGAVAQIQKPLELGAYYHSIINLHTFKKAKGNKTLSLLMFIIVYQRATNQIISVQLLWRSFHSRPTSAIRRDR